MKNVLIYSLVNVIALIIIYAITCFVVWQFPVDFGSWKFDSRCFYIFLVGSVVFLVNFAIYNIFYN